MSKNLQIQPRQDGSAGSGFPLCSKISAPDTFSRHILRRDRCVGTGLLQEAIKKAKAYYCLDCGKCTSVCPIALRNEAFIPRLLVKQAIMEEEVIKNGLIWDCLTCKMCNEKCESGVQYAEFIRDIRIEACKTGGVGICAHQGALQSIMRMMTTPELKQNRLNWVTNVKGKGGTPSPLRTLLPRDEGEVLYFVGCLPYFDAFFTDLALDTLQIAKDSIKILNTLGIEPVLMPNERCCGHDLLWTGDVENFKKLSYLNIEQIKKTGCKKIITSCPECYYTLKESYPAYIGSMGVEVMHITEFLSQKLSAINFRTPNAEHRTPRTVTYQDPCRLGRFSGIYEEPREIIKHLGLELVEMGKHSRNSICCGTSGWMNCSQYSKQIQIARLKEAKSTGASTLITGCPKCQIHFKCAIKGSGDTPPPLKTLLPREVELSEEARIEIKDLISLVAGGE
ncbi:MAG: (Fe-S)-binding protein [Candidatus Stahlbacteria bacterium]|nr:(Fe-S)-binding protein [Candidatus Stahlbacteria bacterium]